MNRVLHRLAVSVPIILTALLTSEATAAIAVSQSRSIAADANAAELPSPNRQSDPAPDLDPFDSTVTATFQDLVDPLEASTASASQTSSIAPSNFATSGRLSASNFDAVSQANSQFHVVFDVEQNSFYQLNATLMGDSVSSPSQIEFALRLHQGSNDAGPVVFERVLDGGSLNDPLLVTGALPQGRYFLQFDAFADPFSTSGGVTADYSASLDVTAIPLPPAIWSAAACLAALAAGRELIVRRIAG